MSNPYKIDWNEYAALARQAVAESKRSRHRRARPWRKAACC